MIDNEHTPPPGYIFPGMEYKASNDKPHSALFWDYEREEWSPVGPSGIWEMDSMLDGSEPFYAIPLADWQAWTIGRIRK